MVTGEKPVLRVFCARSTTKYFYYCCVLIIYYPHYLISSQLLQKNLPHMVNNLNIELFKLIFNIRNEFYEIDNFKSCFLLLH